MIQRTPIKTSAHRRGFTIVEILVVVTIIVLLIGILVPAISGVQKHAQLANTSARLNAIRSGLEQYFNEFGMFPPSSCGPPLAGQYNGANIRGQAMLAQGLMGYMPFDVDGSGPTYANGSASPSPTDPTLGFRTRQSAMGGKIYGPYVPNDPKGYKQNTPGQDEVFIDPFGQEILYFRSTTFLRTSATASGPVASIFDTAANNASSLTGSGGATPASYFVSTDCSLKADLTPFPIDPFTGLPANPTTAMPAFYKLISSGLSNAPSGAVTGSSSYLLISAGPDKIYFTADDVVLSKQ